MEPTPRPTVSMFRGDNWIRCCICGELHVDPYPDLYEDDEDQKWDFCKGQCAHDAGMD